MCQIVVGLDGITVSISIILYFSIKHSAGPSSSISVSFQQSNAVQLALAFFIDESSLHTILTTKYILNQHREMALCVAELIDYAWGPC